MNKQQLRIFNLQNSAKVVEVRNVQLQSCIVTLYRHLYR